MNCKDCPYFLDTFNHINFYYNTLERKNIIPTVSYKDAIKNAEEMFWCEKVGGDVYQFGYCSDCLHINDKKILKKGKRKKNKRERYLSYKNHLKRLYYEVGDYYLTPVRYEDEIRIRGYISVKRDKPYYKREYRRKRSQYLKRQSNRKIRKYKGDLGNGRMCHKLFDFWWEYD